MHRGYSTLQPCRLFPLSRHDDADDDDDVDDGDDNGDSDDEDDAESVDTGGGDDHN